MSGRGGRYVISVVTVREAAENYDRLNAEVGRIMRLMGVPEAMIGLSQFVRDKSEAFTLTSAVGGRHSVPVHGQVYVPEICVDLAVFDPELPPAVDRSPSWRAADIRDRMQAVIAHEYEEATAHDRGLNGGEYPAPVRQALAWIQSADFELSKAALDLVHDYGHDLAVETAPATSLAGLSDLARRILEEYAADLRRRRASRS